MSSQQANSCHDVCYPVGTLYSGLGMHQHFPHLSAPNLLNETWHQTTGRICWYIRLCRASGLYVNQTVVTLTMTWRRSEHWQQSTIQANQCCCTTKARCQNKCNYIRRQNECESCFNICSHIQRTFKETVHKRCEMERFIILQTRLREKSEGNWTHWEQLLQWNGVII